MMIAIKLFFAFIFHAINVVTLYLIGTAAVSKSVKFSSKLRIERVSSVDSFSLVIIFGSLKNIVL